MVPISLLLLLEQLAVSSYHPLVHLLGHVLLDETALAQILSLFIEHVEDFALFGLLLGCLGLFLFLTGRVVSLGARGGARSPSPAALHDGRRLAATLVLRVRSIAPGLAVDVLREEARVLGKGEGVLRVVARLLHAFLPLALVVVHVGGARLLHLGHLVVSSQIVQLISSEVHRRRAHRRRIAVLLLTEGKLLRLSVSNASDLL